MSNALWMLGGTGGRLLSQATTATAGRLSDPAVQERIAPIMNALLAVGAIVFVVWAILRFVYPRKFGLAATPGRPNALNPFHLLAILLLWFAVMQAVALGQGLPYAPASDPRLLLAGLAAGLILLGSSLLAGHLTFRGGLWRGLGLSFRHWPWDLVRGVLGYLAAVPLSYGIHGLVVYLIQQFAHDKTIQEHQLLEFLAPEYGPLLRVIAVFTAVLLAPLAEEIFFRGLLQSMLRKYFGRPWGAILVTSLIFALLHMQNWQHLPALFLLAIVIGYNYERCGRLLPAIVVHALFNGVTVALAIYAYS